MFCCSVCLLGYLLIIYKRLPLERLLQGTRYLDNSDGRQDIYVVVNSPTPYVLQLKSHMPHGAQAILNVRSRRTIRQLKIPRSKFARSWQPTSQEFRARAFDIELAVSGACVASFMMEEKTSETRPGH